MSEELLAVGQVVAGRYRVERVLGRGGMGVVVAARHLDLDETFALKVMTPEAFGSADAVERFIREARMAAKLKSAHAIRVSDSGRLPNGAPYLAMEYLQGHDLEKELDTRGPLPPAEAASYVIQACDVLAEAHGLGIVHRDIKPANLFLTRMPNGTPCIKVLDFGIALHADALTGPRMTQTTAVFGTPLYMSPEQMKSAKSVDPRADIWSLGVVLYELVTGGVPFDAGSMTELVAKVFTELPVFPSARRAGVSPEMEAVIMRCLERDPARRYPTVSALSLALQQVIASGGATARAPSTMGAGTHSPGAAAPSAYSAGATAPGAYSTGGATPGTYPPGAAAPGAYSASAAAPGTYPAGAAAPGTYPPGAVVPGMYPPNGMAPGTYPPNAMAPGTYPPGGIPVGTHPPGTPSAGAFPGGATTSRGMPTDMALSSGTARAPSSSTVPVIVGGVALFALVAVLLGLFVLRGSAEHASATTAVEPPSDQKPASSVPGTVPGTVPEVVPTPPSPPTSTAATEPAPSATASESAGGAVTAAPSGGKKASPKASAAPSATHSKTRGGFL